LSASPTGPAPCNGVSVLEVQNDLNASIEVSERSGYGVVSPMPTTLLGPGWHTLELEPDRAHFIVARTAGEKPFSSYPIPINDPRVRMTVRCRSIG
jgi:hypothetical protein